jgi:hypothetical protein
MFLLLAAVALISSLIAALAVQDQRRKLSAIGSFALSS